MNQGASVIAARVPRDVGGLTLAVGIGVHTWEFEQLRQPIIELLQEPLPMYFPARPAEDERPCARADQVSYAVQKKI